MFLDAGANIGMQTRKLFEADKVSGCLQTGDRHRCYKDLFTDAFGTIQQRRRPEWGVCAFLFEPNPVHTLRLKQLEAAYRKQVGVQGGIRGRAWDVGMRTSEAQIGIARFCLR